MSNELGKAPCSVLVCADGSGDAPSFAWFDGRRFVEVFPVRSGWLVIWGSLGENERGVRLGNRIYRDESGVRHRLSAAVFELTADRAAAKQAVEQFNRDGLPARQFETLPVHG